MREFDHNGLLLAEFQGKLFEKSGELDCSTGVFIRRFLHSELLKRMDTNDPSAVSLDVNDGISDILGQFGESDYGKYIMKLFDYRQLNALYLPFHTQDPEWCIQNLLEINDLSEVVFDKNRRLQEIMKREYVNVQLVCPN